MALAILHIALVGTSTCFILPELRIQPPTMDFAREKDNTSNKDEKESFIDDMANRGSGNECFSEQHAKEVEYWIEYFYIIL